MDKKKENTKKETKKVVEETKEAKNKIGGKVDKATNGTKQNKLEKNEKVYNEIKSNNDIKNIEYIKAAEGKKNEEVKNTELIKAEDIEIDEKKLSKINEEIRENKKISRNNEVKKEKYMRILRNVVIAVMGIAYISINIIGAKRIPQEQYQLDLKVFIILSVISSILLFEKAFKSDKFRFALLGIELLVLGGATIMLLHLYNLQNANILKYSKLFILIWSVYYIIKSIVIAVKRVDLDKKEVENN